MQMSACPVSFGKSACWQGYFGGLGSIRFSSLGNNGLDDDDGRHGDVTFDRYAWKQFGCCGVLIDICGHDNADCHFAL